ARPADEGRTNEGGSGDGRGRPRKLERHRIPPFGLNKHAGWPKSTLLRWLSIDLPTGFSLSNTNCVMA
ncbi:MAG TPA: hypothetical protein VMI72_15800, partial [Roseiarcus sp.]|nr:hypothetical protein [Roseiarcus sp.]